MNPILYIAAGEIGQTIAAVIRQVIMTIFEVVTPVLVVLGVGQVLVGLLLGLGFRQEFLGWRLVISGIITLIFVYVVVPFLLQFI
ncbi:MAG: hypothetical protein QXP81_08640 [Nitrososphaerota archaeon]